MNKDILILILGMTVVTYIPRLLPLVMISKLDLPEWLKKFLRFIPYTALGALIVPGVFSSTPRMPIAAVMGILFAFCYGWYKGGIIISVFGAVLVTFIILMVGNGFIF